LIEKFEVDMINMTDFFIYFYFSNIIFIIYFVII